MTYTCTDRDLEELAASLRTARSAATLLVSTLRTIRMDAEDAANFADDALDSLNLLVAQAEAEIARRDKSEKRHVRGLTVGAGRTVL